MKPEIKKLYDEANLKFARVSELREEYKEKEMPQDTVNEITALLDEVETLTEKAKGLEREAALADTFNKAVNDIPVPAKGAMGLSNETKLALQESGVPLPVIEKRFYNEAKAKAFIATMTLWKAGAGALTPEMKALATAPGAAGGYLVADVVQAKFIELAAETVIMRQIAQVLPPIPGGSTVSPAEDTELSDAEWTTEIKTGSEDSIEPFGGRVLTPHPLAKRIKVSKTLLRAATLLNVEQFIFSRLNRKFAEPEEYAFINGSGAQQPLGLLTASGISSTSTAASNTLAADDIINWAYGLGSAYAGNAKILCNRSLIRKIRLLKGSDNNYLWQPGLSAGSPSTILDFPYFLSDGYPTGLTSDAFDDNALVATIGDFSYYWIVDSLNLEIQRLEELYAETNQVGYIGRKETDGMPVRTAAFRHLKIKA